jgi:hypothetical protein
MMHGMNLGEEIHHVLPPFSGFIPLGLWRPVGFPRYLDISHVWAIVGEAVLDQILGGKT